MIGMSPTGSLPTVLGGMVVGEAGFMCSNVSLNVAGTAVLEEDRYGLAAGLLNTSIHWGAAGVLAS
jgi:hypothetical protein